MKSQFNDFESFKQFLIDWYPDVDKFSDKELFLHYVWYDMTVSKLPDFIEFFPGDRVYRKEN